MQVVPVPDISVTYYYKCVSLFHFCLWIKQDTFINPLTLYGLLLSPYNSLEVSKNHRGEDKGQRRSVVNRITNLIKINNGIQ